MRTTLTILTFLLAFVASFATDLEAAREAAAEGDWVQAATHIRKAIEKNPLDIPSLKLGARIYLELDIHDTALSYAHRVFEADDREKDNVLLYAQALRENSQAPEATVVLRKYLRKNDDVDVSLELVNALMTADSLKSAELVATTARDRHKNSPAAYLALGNFYFNSKPIPVFELAVQNYDEALHLDSTLVMAHFNLAICYWRMGNRETDQDLGNELFTRSLKEWDQVTKMDPKNARAWFEQGKILYLAGKYASSAKALTVYRELRPLGTGEVMASWYLGESLFKQNLCDSAKQHLENAAASIDSLKPKVSLMMARCTFQAKKWKECSDYYLASISIKPRWEKSDYWYFGAALVLAGDTSRAINVMAEASERDPKSCGFMFRYALLLQSRLMYARSTDIFRQRLVNCSDSLDAKIHLFIGNNFFSDSLVDSAVASYERALALNPKYIYATLRLGETYLAKGDVVTGQSLLEKVITNAQVTTSVDERNYGVGAIIRLNGIDLQDKKWQSLIDRSKIGKDLNPKSVGSWLYLAIGYQGLQDVENAKKSYKEVLKLDPNNDAAKKNLKALGN
ncbi:MAG: tetratricopeptide repeat protein [Candidatus Kapabacteria bacterium]|nr:tetratricopeptide repeat protein [Candidatus Kapabacteria bacterium]